MATEKIQKVVLPEMKIKADKAGKPTGIEAEVSKMGVLGTPGQIDMKALERMLATLDAQGK